MKPQHMLALTKESLTLIEEKLKGLGLVEAPEVFNPKGLSAGQYIKIPTEGGQYQVGSGELGKPLTFWWLQY